MMALRELSSLDKALGLIKPNKYSTQGDKKDLNSYLEDKVYLAGSQFTLADTLVYYGIHRIIVDLAVQEKEKHINVTRWFDQVQHYPGVQHHLPPVVVLRNRVYTSGHH